MIIALQKHWFAGSNECQYNTPVYALARSFNKKVKGASNGIGSCGGLMVEYSPSEVEDSVYHTKRPHKVSSLPKLARPHWTHYLIELDPLFSMPM